MGARRREFARQAEEHAQGSREQLMQIQEALQERVSVLQRYPTCFRRGVETKCHGPMKQNAETECESRLKQSATDY